jgi:nucleoid-associated protein YgaU
MSARDDRPDFSNVQFGGSSSAPEAAGSQRTYTVVAGDSLSKIAKKVYGKSSKWKVIFEANRDIVKDPDLIHPGQVLKIPDA